MQKSIVIDSFPESALRYRDNYAIVVVDVFRFSTTVATALNLGRRVYPVQNTDQAFVKGSTLVNPMLVGEMGGNMPYDFDMTNSPAEMAARTSMSQQAHRPMVIVSSSGSQLLLNAHGSEEVLVACLRNYTAVARYAAERHSKIAVLGAGTHGQFRREDQLGCVRVAEQLVALGYTPETEQTKELLEQWRDADLETLRHGRSGAYLERTGQSKDIDFTLNHIDDLPIVPGLVNDEIIVANKDDLVA